MAFDLFAEFEKMCKEEEKAALEAAKKAGENSPAANDPEPVYSPEPKDPEPPSSGGSKDPEPESSGESEEN